VIVGLQEERARLADDPPALSAVGKQVTWKMFSTPVDTPIGRLPTIGIEWRARVIMVERGWNHQACARS